MKTNKIIRWIVYIATLTIIWISCGLLFNYLLFHKDAVDGTTGHYEPKVYITPTGKCYHTFTCNYTTTICEIGLYQAEQKGYRACSHCKGVYYDTIWIEGTNGQVEKDDYITSFILALILDIPIGYGIYCLNNKHNN